MVKCFPTSKGVRVGFRFFSRWLEEYFGIYDVCQRVLYDIPGGHGMLKYGVQGVFWGIEGVLRSVCRVFKGC